MVWMKPAGAVMRCMRVRRRSRGCRSVAGWEKTDGYKGYKGLENHYFMHETKQVLIWSSTFVQAPFHVHKAISNRGFAFHLSNIISVHLRSPSPNALYITGDMLYTPNFFSCNKYLTFRKIASKFTQCRAHSLRLPSKHPEVPGT